MPHAPSMHHGRQDPLDPRTPLRTAPHRPIPPQGDTTGRQRVRAIDVAHGRRRSSTRNPPAPSLSAGRASESRPASDRIPRSFVRTSPSNVPQVGSVPPGLPPVDRSKSHDFTGHHPRAEALGYRRSADLCRPTSSPFQRQRCRCAAAREAARRRRRGNPGTTRPDARPCAVPVCRARVPSAPTRADGLRRRLGTPCGAGGSPGGWAPRSTARSVSTRLRVARDPPVAIRGRYNWAIAGEIDARSLSPPTTIAESTRTVSSRDDSNP